MNLWCLSCLAAWTSFFQANTASGMGTEQHDMTKYLNGLIWLESRNNKKPQVKWLKTLDNINMGFLEEIQTSSKQRVKLNPISGPQRGCHPDSRGYADDREDHAPCPQQCHRHSEGDICRDHRVASGLQRLLPL